MENKKKEILELTLLLDLKVKEYSKLEKNYEMNKDSLNEKQLMIVKNKYEEILKEIKAINSKLKKLKEE